MEKVKLGLIGYPLSHSFSKNYYDDKILKERIQGMQYDLYPLEQIGQFPRLIKNETLLAGVNVTIPYKIAVLDYLDELSPEAKEIGAVNCIRIRRDRGDKPFLSGFNSDVYGFETSLRPLLSAHHLKALVLGNGGAAKAVCYALDKMEISWRIVSRNPTAGTNQLSYDQLNAALIGTHTLVINTTPLGTFPDVKDYAPIPYQFLSRDHLLYDLIYNPAETAFLQKGRHFGASTKNGYEMLVLQAERNWEIWTEGEGDE